MANMLCFHLQDTVTSFSALSLTLTFLNAKFIINYSSFYRKTPWKKNGRQKRRKRGQLLTRKGKRVNNRLMFRRRKMRGMLMKESKTILVTEREPAVPWSLRERVNSNAKQRSKKRAWTRWKDQMTMKPPSKVKNSNLWVNQLCKKKTFNILWYFIFKEQKMRSKKAIKVKRKNKINAELSGGSSQPADLSETLGEPQPLLSRQILARVWCFAWWMLHFIFTSLSCLLLDLYRKAILALKERQDQGQRTWRCWTAPLLM